MKRFIGLIIVFAGIFLLLSNLGVFEIENFSSIFWASIMVTVGIFGIVVKKRAELVFILLIVLGSLLILANIGIITFNLLGVIILPVILIIVGGSFIFNFSPITNKGIKKDNSYITIFGGIEETHHDEKFEKSEVTTIFGGSEVDYSQIKLKGKTAYISVNVIFGGVTIKVPEGVKVITKGFPIFGGVDNQLKNVESDQELIVDYSVVFGALEIKKIK